MMSPENGMEPALGISGNGEMTTKMYEIDGRTISITTGRSPKAPLVLLIGNSESCINMDASISKTFKGDFALAVVICRDMKSDTIPWDATDPLDSSIKYRSSADSLIKSITERVIPTVEGDNGLEPEYRVLAGYSFGGLFAMYALFRTGIFSRVACVSSAFWYPGIEIFEDTAMMDRIPDKAYFSLKKSATVGGNPISIRAEVNTASIARACHNAGTETRLDLSGAEHYYDPLVRIGKGIAWVLEPRKCDVQS